MVKSGEILSGYMEELDNQEIYNETQDEVLKVFIHERGLEVDEAIEKHFAQLVPSQRPRRPTWPVRDQALIR